MAQQQNNNAQNDQGEQYVPTLVDYQLTVNESEMINYVVNTRSVASVADLESIRINLNLQNPEFARKSVILAIHCAHNSSSELETFDITLRDGPDGFSANEWVLAIKRRVTLRQFCAVWARYVFDHMIRSGTPPSNYVQKGFSTDTRYAAFDFFYGVTSEASVKKEGMIRMPTDEELRASALNAHLSIMAANRQRQGRLSNKAEISVVENLPAPRMQLLDL
uniref:Capsid protein n=1 Tax=Perth betaflexivirus 1 TaxID=2201306 RepID=A0A2U8JQE9_9VIRU|nr:structural protein [Perth betaflexivirus 1]